MNSLLNKFYIKKKLLDKPDNVILLKDKVNNYNDVLNLFNNYPLYIICLFLIFMAENFKIK